MNETRDTVFLNRCGHRVMPSDDATVVPRSGAFALVRREGLWLLVWPPYAPRVPELPGGGIDPGENIDMAIQREWREETGLASDWMTNPLKAYSHTRGFYADDVDSFWIYTQTFRLYDYPFPVKADEPWTTPENGIARWVDRETLRQAPVNVLHGQAIQALLD